MNSYNQTSAKISDDIDISKVRPWRPNHMVCTRITNDCNLVLEQLQRKIIAIEKGNEQFKVNPANMHITHLAIGESPVILQMFKDCELKIQQVYRHKPIPFKLVDLTNFNGNICVRLAGEYLLACQDIYQKECDIKGVRYDPLQSYHVTLFKKDYKRGLTPSIIELNLENIPVEQHTFYFDKIDLCKMKKLGQVNYFPILCSTHIG
jgi:hypothetical protein